MLLGYSRGVSGRRTEVQRMKVFESCQCAGVILSWGGPWWEGLMSGSGLGGRIVQTVHVAMVVIQQSSTNIISTVRILI